MGSPDESAVEGPGEGAEDAAVVRAVEGDPAALEALLGEHLEDVCARLDVSAKWQRHLDFEDLYPTRTREELVALFPDHLAWPRPDIFYGGAHSAELTATGDFAGIGDPRRDGAAVVA